MFDQTSIQQAFFSVQENHGCAGVDGVSIERFVERLSENLMELRRELAERSYFPLPH